jgi:hypothetical protein
MEALVHFTTNLYFCEGSVAIAFELAPGDVWANCWQSLLDPIIQALSEAMGDKEKLLDDFIYEPSSAREECDLFVQLHCGKEAIVHYKDWGDLYDYFVFRAAQEDDNTKAHELRKQLCQCHGVSCC